MGDMKARQDELPIPDVKAWLTRSAAAAKLGVDPATVSRWSMSGILTAYTPVAAAGETPQPLFYGRDVDELAAARRLLGGRRAPAA